MCSIKEKKSQSVGRDPKTHWKQKNLFNVFTDFQEDIVLRNEQTEFSTEKWRLKNKSNSRIKSNIPKVKKKSLYWTNNRLEVIEKQSINLKTCSPI